jgi:hypothetical protein
MFRTFDESVCPIFGQGQRGSMGTQPSRDGTLTLVNMGTATWLGPSASELTLPPRGIGPERPRSLQLFSWTSIASGASARLRGKPACSRCSANAVKVPPNVVKHLSGDYVVNSPPSTSCSTPVLDFGGLDRFKEQAGKHPPATKPRGAYPANPGELGRRGSEFGLILRVIQNMAVRAAGLTD